MLEKDRELRVFVCGVDKLVSRELKHADIELIAQEFAIDLTRAVAGSEEFEE